MENSKIGVTDSTPLDRDNMIAKEGGGVGDKESAYSDHRHGNEQKGPNGDEVEEMGLNIDKPTDKID